MQPPRPKVFVIGRNKTGTTSMRVALRDLGYRIGDQAAAELLLDNWAQRDFRRIVEYCRSADAFQDIPFSLDYTYQAVDAAFPGSKFILTVRDSASQWYDSLMRAKAHLRTAEDLKNWSYRRRGWMWRAAQVVYGIDENSLYDPQIYMEHYQAHNRRVRDYFRHRPEDLLEINLADAGAMQSLCDFLGVDSHGHIMPHRNSRTRLAPPEQRAPTGSREADGPGIQAGPILAADVLDAVRKEDPALADRLQADAAEALIQQVFNGICNSLSGMQGALNYTGLGQFHVKKGKGRGRMIFFRPATRGAKVPEPPR
jgi:hypothetical protein